MVLYFCGDFGVYSLALAYSIPKSEGTVVCLTKKKMHLVCGWVRVLWCRFNTVGKERYLYMETPHRLSGDWLTERWPKVCRNLPGSFLGVGSVFTNSLLMVSLIKHSFSDNKNYLCIWESHFSWAFISWNINSSFTHYWILFRGHTK